MKKQIWLLAAIAAVALWGCEEGEAMGGSYGAETAAMPESQADLDPMNEASAGVPVRDEMATTATSMTMAAYQRQIIRRADVSLKVEDTKDLESKLRSTIKSHQGFVMDLSQQRPSEETASLSATLRVPVAKFDDALKAIKELGHVESSSVTGEDVTDQLVDIEARLRALRAQENAYLGIMNKANKVEDVLSVQDRLINVRTQIEQIAAQQKSLKDQVSYSTITVNAAKRGDIGSKTDPNWVAGSWGEATGSFGAFLKGLGSMMIWILVYSPVWLLLIGGFWLFIRLISRPSKKKTAA